MPLNSNIPLDQALNFSSILTFTEVNASTINGRPKEFIFTGSALPNKGVAFGIENRIHSTFYPGNRLQATQQVMGSMLSNTNFEFDLRRKLLSRTPLVYQNENGNEERIVSPLRIVDLLKEAAESGALFRVVWTSIINRINGSVQTAESIDEEKFEVVREGRILSVNDPIQTADEVGVTVVFAWSSKGSTQEKEVAIRQEDDFQKIASAFEQSLAGLETAISEREGINQFKEVPKGASSLSLGNLERIAALPTTLARRFSANVREKTTQIKRLGRIFRTLRSQPASVANTFLDLSVNTRAVMVDFERSVTQIPVEQQSVSTRLSDQLRAYQYNASILDVVEFAKRRAFLLEEQSKRTLLQTSGERDTHKRTGQRLFQQQILAYYLVKEGDTSYSVAQRFYGSIDTKEIILKANRLPFHTVNLVPGNYLIIPKIASNEAS